MAADREGHGWDFSPAVRKADRAFTMAHLSDDSTVAKMGHPRLW